MEDYLWKLIDRNAEKITKATPKDSAEYKLAWIVGVVSTNMLAIGPERTFEILDEILKR